MHFCTGACATPVNQYIRENYLAMLIAGKKELPRDILENVALNNYIENKLRDQLPKNDTIECIYGLINCMYLSDSHPDYHNAPIKIKNRTNFAESATAYVETGFNLIKDRQELLEKFIELFCKKEGDEILRDEKKINIMYDNFLEKHGIVSEKQKIIKKYIGDMNMNNNEQYRHLMIDFSHNADVITLCDLIFELPNKLREKTYEMTDKDEINKVYEKIRTEAIQNINEVYEKMLKETIQNSDKGSGKAVKIESKKPSIWIDKLLCPRTKESVEKHIRRIKVNSERSM